MKEWIVEQTLDIPLEKYDRLFCHEDLTFANKFHQKSGHVMLNQTTLLNPLNEMISKSDGEGDQAWVFQAMKEARLVSDEKPTLDREWFLLPQLKAKKKDNVEIPEEVITSVYPSENISQEWFCRVEQFNLPLPLPAKVQRLIFGEDYEKSGSHMQSVHLRPKKVELSDGQRGVLVETQSNPLNGLLHGKFSIKQLYWITPDPKDPVGKCHVKIWNRLQVQKMSVAINHAVETFALPFSKKLQKQLFHDMVEHAMTQ